MATTEAVTDRAADLERYIQLHALEILVTSSYAFGQALEEHLPSLSLEDGIDLRPGGPENESLLELWARLMPEKFEVSAAGQVVLARGNFLLARMARSITPEVVEETARYFEGLADRHLSAIQGGEDA